MTEPLRIIGIEASPYSVKLRAYCRYRHIPYRWLSRMPQFYAPTQHLKPLIMPVAQHPDGRFETDSTPIILGLEAKAERERAIFTQNPLLDFLAYLIEDFADEWLTKCLFHYRFSYPQDRAFGPHWVMDDAHPEVTTDELNTLVKNFLERQTERMPLVGCTPENAPILEQSFERVLEILEPYVALDKFIFGSRPSLADFGLYGQLKTLATDPTPQNIMREVAPRLTHWVRRADDLSGLDGAFKPENELDPQIRTLIKFVCEIYLPYLHANLSAHEQGEKAFSVELLEQTYTQKVFRYHVKCFSFLHAKYQDLSNNERIRLEDITQADFHVFNRGP